MDIKTMIINLKILGQLDTGSKINTQDHYFTIDDKRIQTFTRWFRADNRRYTYEKIAKLVEDLIRFYDTENKPPVGYTNENFREILENAVNGLEKLKGTYLDDKTIVSMFEVEIDLLNRLIVRIPKETKETKETKKDR